MIRFHAPLRSSCAQRRHDSRRRRLRVHRRRWESKNTSNARITALDDDNDPTTRNLRIVRNLHSRLLSLFFSLLFRSLLFRTVVIVTRDTVDESSRILKLRGLNCSLIPAARGRLTSMNRCHQIRD